VISGENLEYIKQVQEKLKIAKIAAAHSRAWWQCCPCMASGAVARVCGLVHGRASLRPLPWLSWSFTRPLFFLQFTLKAFISIKSEDFC